MALNKEVSNKARQLIGSYLSDIRKNKGISMYKIAKYTGMTENQVKSIENGDKNYSIDSFMAYTFALDCYFYLANKDGKELDNEYLIKQSKNPV